MDAKATTLNMARLDVLSDKIDQQMCQFIHTDLLKKFSNDPDVDEIMLPPALDDLEGQKSFVLQMADSMGLQVSLDSHNGLHLRKEHDLVSRQHSYLELAPSSLNMIAEDLKNVHTQDAESQGTSRDKVANRRFSNASGARCAGRLNILDSPPEVTLLGESAEFLRHRRSLPIFSYRSEILGTLEQQQVVVIAGDVGSGKTTQVPQYILEDAHAKKIPCRIVSIQPRRLNVLAAVDRVTAERGVTGERVIGYQIPLESRGTMTCPLTFCTTGVFLRTLHGGDQCLKGITHIIIDQAHERDRFTDVLMGFLRMRLPQYPGLRLIILCANVVPHTLASYFHQEKFIKIATPNQPVSQFFLEDILTCTKFLSKQVLLAGAGSGEKTFGPSAVFDNYISEAWFKGSEQIFNHLLKLAQQGAMPIDYQHSRTGITLLMVAAIHGNLDFVKACIALGANPTFTIRGMTPHDLANEFARPEVADLLWSYSQVFGSEVGNNIRMAQPFLLNQDSPDEVLKKFYAKYSQDHANLDLIIEVLNFVLGYQAGTVLVFLPGYNEVIELRDMIAASASPLNQKIEIHILHGYLLLNDFKKLFLAPSEGKRKVILTTNIAETSFLFQDVVCVIDCGLLRDKEIEVVITSQKKTAWISKVSVAQRLMHLRNGGLYFHLYPRCKLEGFQDLPIPEITRHSLIDACLYARVIMSDEMRLPQFFCSLPDSPPTTMVHQAVEILQSIDALDSFGKPTEVGIRLMELPIDPRLGKTVLVATVLKCLDPVLTIACCLARDDPFITPANPDERNAAMKRKFELVADNMSDHLALLRAYHLWEKASDEVRKRQVCQDNFLSSSALELIFLLRVSMVGELRASGYIRGRGQCDMRSLNLHSETWTAVKAALTAGLYPNIARYCPINGSIVTHDEMKSQFHYSSTFLAQEAKINGVGISNQSQAAQAGPASQASSQQSKIYPQYPFKPWILYEDKQRAGQFMILRCCTAITPITLLTFAGHMNYTLQVEPLPHSPNNASICDLLGNDDESDDMDEEEIRQVCNEFKLAHMTDHLVGFNRAMQHHKKVSKPRKHNVLLKLNDYVRFIVDAHACQLLLSMRQKFQAVMTKCIQEPGRNCNPYEDAALRTVLSVLSAEEMAMHFHHPSGVGRRPTNVSAESMLVSPDLKPGDVFPVRRYVTYTPPPKGYFYETKEVIKGTSQLPTTLKAPPKMTIQEPRFTNFGNMTCVPSADLLSKPFPPPNMLNTSWPTYDAAAMNGRRIFKSYKPK